MLLHTEHELSAKHIQTDRQTHAQCFIFFPPQQSGECVSSSLCMNRVIKDIQKLRTSSEVLMSLTLHMC